MRVQGRLESVDGQPALAIRHGTQQGERLVITSAGWRLEGIDGLSSGKPLASGADILSGHLVSLAHIADQLVVAVDGTQLCAYDVPPVDPGLQRTHVSVEGQGSLVFASLHIQRDLHYTCNYVLKQFRRRQAGPARQGAEHRLR